MLITALLTKAKSQDRDIYRAGYQPELLERLVSDPRWSTMFAPTAFFRRCIITLMDTYTAQVAEFSSISEVSAESKHFESKMSIN